VRAKDEFLEQSLAVGCAVVEVFGLCHEQRVETVDGFDFKVYVIRLLNAGFDVCHGYGLIILRFTDIFEDALVTDFAGGDHHTAQVEDDFAEQLLLYDTEDVRFCSRVYYDFL